MAIFRIDFVKRSEAVVRPKPELPLAAKGHRTFQRLPVAGFQLGLETKLAFQFCPDQRMVLGFDGPQVIVNLVRVHEDKWLPLCHDDYNYGRDEPVVKQWSLLFGLRADWGYLGPGFIR